MNLYLIGYRGSGKSTVGKLLSSRIGRVCVDIDDYIEELTETSIKRIFETSGEQAFRSIERRIICGYTHTANLILSLGGGAPMDDAVRQSLKQHGKTVWLKAEPEVLWKRICSDLDAAEQRPDLTDLGGLEEVQHVLAQRGPVYEECADYRIDVDELTPEQIADDVARWWNSVDNKHQDRYPGTDDAR